MLRIIPGRLIDQASWPVRTTGRVQIDLIDSSEVSVGLRSVRSKLTVRTKLGIAIGALALLVVAIIAAVLWSVAQQNADATLIAIAGRQRALSQRIGVHVLGLEKGRDDPADIELHTLQLEHDLALFEGTLRALRKGGEAVGTDGHDVNVPAPDDPLLVSQLDQVAAVWDRMQRAVATVLSTAPFDPGFAEAVLEVERLTDPLLEETNTTVQIYETLAETKLGRLRMVMWVFLAILVAVAVGALVLTASESVERERVERGRAQAQRLESIGALAGGIAHDFNNLLGVIQNHALFASRTLAPSSEAHADVEQVLVATTKATQLTAQLLGFARHDDDSAEVVDLNEVVRAINALLGRTLGEEIILHEELSDDLWPVQVNRSALEQSLVNLALNARDAMSVGGTITVSTANALIDATDAPDTLATGRYVRLRVRDTGEGMTPETLGRAIEPFFSTKPVGEGTGLGLSSAQGFVKRAGGRLSIESDADRGTTVEILLPATDKPVPKKEVRHVAKSEPTNENENDETIMVVEDDGQVRAMTARILDKAGYCVLAADGGAAAVEKARAHDDRLHLLLTDLVMPGMSGIELADTMTAEFPGLEVLFMTGYAKPPLNVPDEVVLVRKPFTDGELTAAVRDALDRRTDI